MRTYGAFQDFKFGGSTIGPNESAVGGEIAIHLHPDLMFFVSGAAHANQAFISLGPVNRCHICLGRIIDAPESPIRTGVRMFFIGI